MAEVLHFGEVTVLIEIICNSRYKVQQTSWLQIKSMEDQNESLHLVINVANTSERWLRGMCLRDKEGEKDFSTFPHETIYTELWF